MKTTRPTERRLRASLFSHVCLLAAVFCNAPAWSGELSSAADAATALPLSTTPAPSPITPARAKLKEIGNRASELALHAIGMLGIHYKHGGTTPESGMDCSGMVRYVFKEAWGSVLPRSAAEISQVGEQVTTQNLQPGDLVFYNTMKRGFSHVGIYLGDNKFIHSPSVGGQVRIESMDLAYWKKRFNGARRMTDPGA
jgi:cell wall-associated NlpC family hydrolase